MREGHYRFGKRSATWFGVAVVALSVAIAAALVFGYSRGSWFGLPRYRLTVEIEGEGTVTPKGGRFKQGTTVTLTATPGQDYLFDRWSGDCDAAQDPLAGTSEVVMDGDKTVRASFVHRPGTTALDLSEDFDTFLAVVGLPGPALEVDRNEIDYVLRGGETEPLYVPNGIPDVAELHLVEAAVKDRHLDMTHRSGICHDLVWAAWQTNLAQAEMDLAGKDPAVIRTVAAYITLGDYKSVQSVTKLVEDRFPGLTIDPAPYNRSMQRYLYWKDDADNDGLPNREEWEAAASTDSPDILDLFARYAFDGERPPKAKADESTTGPAEAEGAKPRVCSGGDTGTFKFLPSVSSGGGSGTVSGGLFPDCGIELGTAEVTLPLGVTVEVRATPDPGSAFSHWEAPDSMLDGSREMTARVMLMGDMTAKACFHRSQLEIAKDDTSFAVTVEQLEKGAVKMQGPDGAHVIAGSAWSTVTVSAKSLDPALKVVGWVVQSSRDADDGQRNYLDTVTIHPIEGYARPLLAAEAPEGLKTTELESSQGGFVTASTVPGQKGRFARRIRFVEGTPVRFDAVAYPGYELNHWEGLSPDNKDLGPHVVVGPPESASVGATVKPEQKYRIRVETAVARPADETQTRERITPPAKRREKPKAAALTSAQQDGLGTFVQTVLKSDIKSVKPGWQERVTWTTPRPTLRLGVTYGAGDEQCDAMIDSENGTVYWCHFKDKWSASPLLKEKTIDDAIPVEQAFAAAVPWLEYCGLPLTRDRYKTILANRGSSPPPEPLAGSSWAIERGFECEGIPCRGPRLAVDVSAYSGDILYFWYVPPVVPEPPKRRITKEAAVEAVRAWFPTCAYLSQGDPGSDPGVAPDVMENIVEVIAFPNELFDPKAKPPPNDKPLKSYHCWEVPFSFTEHEHVFNAWLWVNIETGKVIGVRPR